MYITHAADSYYEYLIKQHQLIGGATDQYRNMYTGAIDAARGHLFHDIEVMRGWRDLTVGSRDDVKGGWAGLMCRCSITDHRYVEHG
jgi:mannosyl-oligosaccharide alpha-1,2-mannosidase